MKYFLAIFTLLFVVSCVHFEIRQDIDPEMTFFGDRIGLRYKLGNLTVNDCLDDLSKDMYNYILLNKEHVKISIHIDCNENINGYTYFTYFINGVEVETNKDVIIKETLMQDAGHIPGFRCISGCSINNNEPPKEVEPEIIPVPETEEIKPEGSDKTKQWKKFL